MSSVVGVVLFPGAGSSSTHSSLVAIEVALSPLPVTRHDFPYRLAGKPFPDKAPVLITSVKAYVRAFAQSLGAPTSKIVIGGRSMGGRMCSMAVADDADPLDVAGLVLVSYPLHPPKKPETMRIEHLPRVTVPTLCVSGTKDNFGTPEELGTAFSVVPGAVTWSWVANGRHELAKDDVDVAQRIALWVGEL
ncbi:MAG: dienelactone hydrolase [Ilumatobacteraceae bacterium]|nr:dienelactone hydrolase [Ilumatobacteraceae bacterium]